MIRLKKRLKNKTITYIHVVAMFVMLFFTIIFASILIYGEYKDFDKEALLLRQEYYDEQKSSIQFDVERVLTFVRSKYDARLSTEQQTDLKQELIHAIEHIYGREDGTGYIFIYDYNGVKISDPIQPESVGQNLYNIQDKNGVKVIKDLIDVSKKPEGGYVEYRWLKPTTHTDSPKISYAKSFEPWQWMIGTGVYLDEIEKNIEKKKEKLKDKLFRYTMEILVMTLIVFGIGWIAIMIVHYVVTKEIATFSDFFKETSTTYKMIDIEQIHLLEFQQMVNYVNRMVEEIRGQKTKLESLNLSLEDKVRRKTKYLNERNKQLDEEKRFNESLVQAQDSFIKHAIHEINTPLAVIITHVDMHKMKFGENRYLSKIEAGTKMIANIFDDLSYTVKKDRFHYPKESLDFSDILETRIHFFEEIIFGNQQTIHADIQPHIKLFFNEVELQRIIDNNLSNATKYARKNSQINVEFKQQEDRILLRFTTDSKKIEDTQRIFEAFHREEDEQGGFGLGLEIVGSICKKEGIEIQVDSTDERTIFSYYFRSDDEITTT